MTVAEFLNHFVYYENKYCIILHHPDIIYYKVVDSIGSTHDKAYLNATGLYSNGGYNNFIDKYGSFEVIDAESSIDSETSNVISEITIKENL